MLVAIEEQTHVEQFQKEQLSNRKALISFLVPRERGWRGARCRDGVQHNPGPGSWRPCLPISVGGAAGELLHCSCQVDTRLVSFHGTGVLGLGVPYTESGQGAQTTDTYSGLS